MIFIKRLRDSLDANSHSFPRLPRQARLAARRTNSLTCSQVLISRLLSGVDRKLPEGRNPILCRPSRGAIHSSDPGRSLAFQHVLQTAPPPPPASTFSANRNHTPGSFLLTSFQVIKMARALTPTPLGDLGLGVFSDGSESLDSGGKEWQVARSARTDPGFHLPFLSLVLL